MQTKNNIPPEFTSEMCNFSPSKPESRHSGAISVHY